MSEDSETNPRAAVPAGEVNPPTVTGFPEGYIYGVTRYADVILSASFPRRLSNILFSLEQYRPRLCELLDGGGGKTTFTQRFDESLSLQMDDDKTVWGKRNITISKFIGFDGNTQEVSRVRGHEIDMFGAGPFASQMPGVAVEMEWNNKDPFFDRDLNNFQALHREGAIAVGVIITRGPRLQHLLKVVLDKYGESSTHWNKLIPKVDLGGGGECPLLLIGIETERIVDVDAAIERLRDLVSAEEFKQDWRGRGFKKWAQAKPTYDALKAEARTLAT